MGDRKELVTLFSRPRNCTKGEGSGMLLGVCWSRLKVLRLSSWRGVGRWVLFGVCCQAILFKIYYMVNAVRMKGLLLLSLITAIVVTQNNATDNNERPPSDLEKHMTGR